METIAELEVSGKAHGLMGAIKSFRTMYGDRFCIVRCNDQVVRLASKNVSREWLWRSQILKVKLRPS